MVLHYRAQCDFEQTCCAIRCAAAKRCSVAFRAHTVRLGEVLTLVASGRRGCNETRYLMLTLDACKALEFELLVRSERGGTAFDAVLEIP